MIDVESLYRTAVAEHRAGRVVAAERLCREILERNQRFAPAWDLLGVARHQQGDCSTAIECVEKAIGLEPLNPVFYHNLGNAYWSVGRLTDAEAALSRAVAMMPSNAATLAMLGKVLHGLGRTEESVAVFDRVLSLTPEIPPAALANGYSELGMAEQAVAGYRQAYARTGDAAFRILAAIQLPPIYQSREDLLAWRGRLEAEIDGLIEQGLKLDATAREATPLFSLAHQGLNDVEIQRKLGRLYQPPELPPPEPPARPDGKIRVGFISSYFNLHTIAKLTSGLISRLARTDLHVTVFSVGQDYDPAARALAAAVQRFVTVSRSLPEARQAILDNPVDVLVYTDIGMDPTTYTLAMSRLAPVQCTTWGHPDTTGLATIDYFISSELYEIPQADAHYSEKLVRLPGLTFYFERAVLPPKLSERAAFGLDSGKRLYACPQTIFKFHPDFDEALAGVLRRDPQGQVVLIRSTYPQPDNLLRQRFSRTMPDVADRVVFIRRLTQPEFMNFLTLVDVMLDPFPFGGGASSLEAFSFGVPVVTLPTEFLRGRYTQAFCRRLGVTSCIARDVADYIEIAVRLATDALFRRRTQEQIVAGQSKLFDDESAVEQWRRFLSVVAFGRPGEAVAHLRP